MASRMLAFDTSGNVTAVAVLDGDRVLIEDSAASQERHAETLLPRIQQCLASAGLSLQQIDVFAVGVGPGSFTGVRVGVATAKGLALATGKPLRGVVSLSALAGSALDSVKADEVLVAPILEAYKGEVFAALYRVSAAECTEALAPFHAAPEDAARVIAQAANGRQFQVLGSGYRRYAERMSPAWAERQYAALDTAWDSPQARHIAREARRGLEREGPSDTARLAPLYVRDSDAQLPKTPLRV